MESAAVGVTIPANNAIINIQDKSRIQVTVFMIFLQAFVVQLPCSIAVIYFMKKNMAPMLKITKQ